MAAKDIGRYHSLSNDDLRIVLLSSLRFFLLSNFASDRLPRYPVPLFLAPLCSVFLALFAIACF